MLAVERVRVLSVFGRKNMVWAFERKYIYDNITVGPESEGRRKGGSPSKEVRSTKLKLKKKEGKVLKLRGYDFYQNRQIYKYSISPLLFIFLLLEVVVTFSWAGNLLMPFCYYFPMTPPWELSTPRAPKKLFLNFKTVSWSRKRRLSYGFVPYFAWAKL